VKPRGGERCGNECDAEGVASAAPYLDLEQDSYFASPKIGVKHCDMFLRAGGILTCPALTVCLCLTCLTFTSAVFFVHNRVGEEMLYCAVAFQAFDHA
jgi:hypothetical protein